MPRTRLVRPGFVKDADLYDAEVAWGLPLRVGFLGLWGVTDREGRFPWKPRELEGDVLPHDPADLADVLDALEAEGFVRRYVVEGKEYGFIPTFHIHQTFHKTEPQSVLPPPAGGFEPPRRISVVSPTTSVGTPWDAVAVGVAVRDADTDPDQRERTPARQSFDRSLIDARIATRLTSDAGRNALSAVLQVAGSKVGVVSELDALLAGTRGKNHHCTPEQLDVALSDYVTNGMSSGRWNAQHFRACVRRAMQPIPDGSPPTRPTNTQKALAAVEGL